MPIREDLKAYYGAEWREYRTWLIAKCKGQCSQCKRTFERGLNACHIRHDPRDRASVVIMCASCHARHDSPHRVAVWRRSRARRHGQLWLLPEIEWSPYPIWQIPAPAIEAIHAQGTLELFSREEHHRPVTVTEQEAME